MYWKAGGTNREPDTASASLTECYSQVCANIGYDCRALDFLVVDKGVGCEAGTELKVISNFVV